MEKSLHFVWNPASVGHVHMMLHQHHAREQNSYQVFCFWDEFCVGPVSSLKSRSKRVQRQKWMKKVFGKGFSEISSDYRVYKYLTKSKLEKSRIYLWQGPSLNSSFLCGQILQFFKDKKVTPEIKLVKVRGPVPYRRSIGEIGAEYSLKPYLKAKNLDPKERGHYLDLYYRMLESQTLLRIKKGKKGFQSVEEDFYDQELIETTALRLQQRKKVFDIDVIAYFLSEQRDWLPMDFVHYRIKELCKAKKLHYQGSLLNRGYGRIQLKMP